MSSAADATKMNFAMKLNYMLSYIATQCEGNAEINAKFILSTEHFLELLETDSLTNLIFFLSLFLFSLLFIFHVIYFSSS